MKVILFYLWLLGLSTCQFPRVEQNLPIIESIRLNQWGFYPDQPKRAVVIDEQGSSDFMIWDHLNERVVFRGEVVLVKEKTLSGKSVGLIDFSNFTSSGEFQVILPGKGKSHKFKIEKKVNQDLAIASLKAYYFQRASTSISEPYGGIWARPAGHPDDQVEVHASAASQERPEGTVVSAPYGWYDAGDYNKYIVNSGITMGTLLSLFEDFPTYFQNQNLKIPESSNLLPDILDEIKWNLDWMLAMQDPLDGGVYHKLTTVKFEGMVMPEEAKAQRFLVFKSTAAALDFAAVMAQASRVYRDFTPEDALVYLKAAEKAWAWAKRNPDQYYQQDELNNTFKPEVFTGAYGDQNLTDEWIWAASELYITTHNLRYWEALKKSDQAFKLPAWPTVSWLGYYSLIRHAGQLNHLPEEWLSVLKINLLDEARELVKMANQVAYKMPMGIKERDFGWGGNSVAANQGILLLYAYQLTGEEIFKTNAQDNLDYLLGRNATGYSFVTGFGSRTPMNPHHRLAAARPDLPPIPGFLVGGPNPGQQDDCDYPSDVADESYVDDYCSYASNEIAINWNAPFAYLTNALEALNEK
ncbi:glycoside hydrolase family 9 protein [Algoriphagus sp.]|uniref:glycoside hydrolase family 9 protein n=1 Tax=Algoriphagus sp. TaxID=1872435 RepID=UPI00261394EB|nr:glycoside hydrolase family 9 protein [Algoriphagus sp.]